MNLEMHGKRNGKDNPIITVAFARFYFLFRLCCISLPDKLRYKIIINKQLDTFDLLGHSISKLTLKKGGGAVRINCPIMGIKEGPG